MPKGHPRPKGERIVRTTIELPEALWTAAKARALEDRTDLRAMVIKLLTAHLWPRRRRRRGPR